MRIYIHTYIHTYVRTDVHAYIRTHTYIFMHILVFGGSVSINFRATLHQARKADAAAKLEALEAEAQEEEVEVRRKSADGARSVRSKKSRDYQ